MTKVSYLSKAAVIAGSILLMTSCDWTTSTVKKSAYHAGELVGKAGTEFGDGVVKGVKTTLKNNINMSAQLEKKGLEIGQVSVESTDTTTDNILSVYFIFNQDIDTTLTVKLINDEGKEFGRVQQKVSGKSGHTAYVDFVFDHHVNINSKGKIILQ